MNPLRILYVEDNPDIRDALSELIGVDGHVVHACANGEEALRAFEAQTFDVLITDVSLPGLSGPDLARRVLSTQPRHWVVFCSGYELGHGLAALGPNVRSSSKAAEPDVMLRLLSEIQTVIEAEAAHASPPSGDSPA